MAKLVWTEEALRWLEDIFEYIAHDDPDAAARTVQAIYDRAQALTQYPEMGERYAGSDALTTPPGMTSSMSWLPVVRSSSV